MIDHWVQREPIVEKVDRQSVWIFQRPTKTAAGVGVLYTFSSGCVDFKQSQTSHNIYLTIKVVSSTCIQHGITVHVYNAEITSSRGGLGTLCYAFLLVTAKSMITLSPHYIRTNTLLNLRPKHSFFPVLQEL